MLVNLLILLLFLGASLFLYFKFMKWVEEYGMGKPVPDGIMFICVMAALSAPVSLVKFISLVFSFILFLL